MPLINLPDGNQANFPDDMSPQQIEAVLQKQYPSQQQPEEKGFVSDYITGPAVAAGTSAARRLGDAGFDMADVAGALLQQFDVTKKAGTSFREFNKQAKGINQQLTQTEIDNPISSAVGGGVGYTAGIMTGPSAITKGMGQVVGKLGGPVASEMASEFPVLSSAAKGAVENSIAGAAMAPEDEKLKQGLIGGVVGGTLGGLAGAVGAGARASEELMATGRARGASLGYPAGSKESMAMAREELATQGKVTTQGKIAERGAQLAQKEIDNITPTEYATQKGSPVEIVGNDMVTRAKAVDEKLNQLYAPLENSAYTVNVKIKGNKVLNEYLPPELPPNATFKDLKAYRQDLNTSIKSAYNQGKTVVAKRLEAIKETITLNMQKIAKAEGMPDRLSQAEKVFKEEKAPFYTFSQTGKLDDIADSVGNLVSSNKFSRSDMKDLITTLGGGTVGKQKAGWLVLQTAIRKAKTGDEPINLAQFNRSINKYSALGLDDVFATPDYKNAVNGINYIVSTAKAGQHIREHHWSLYIIGPLVQSLTQSPKGMRVLQIIGNPSTKQKVRNEMINQLIQRGVVGGVGNITDETPPEQQ